MPDAAGLPQPVTNAERDATASFLNWVAELVDHDKAETDRAARTAAWCADPK